MPEHGTQMKLVMLLSDGSKAIFKPKRCGGVVWKVWWGCLEGVVGLFGRCGGVVWRVLWVV